MCIKIRKLFVTILGFSLLFLSPVPTHADTTVSYIYDGDGTRVAKIENGKTTLYVGNMEKVLETGVVTKYYSLGSSTIAIRTGSTLNYITSDQLGSSRQMTDANGAKTGDSSYFPYGQTRVSSGTSPTRQYTGQINDDTTGLYFYNARYYNPQNGLFVTADQGTNSNKYSYVSGNPVNHLDPSGKYRKNIQENPWFVETEVIPEIEDRFGVRFFNGSTNKWSADELWKLEDLFESIPQHYYEGYSFYKIKGQEDFAVVYSGAYTNPYEKKVYIEIGNGKSSTNNAARGRPITFSEMWGSIEYITAHELFHGPSIRAGQPYLDEFLKVMADKNVYWWSDQSDKSTAEFEKLFSNYRQKNKFASFQNVYGENITVSNPLKLPTGYAAESPLEAMAEYGGIYLYTMYNPLVMINTYNRSVPNVIKEFDQY